MFLKAFLATMTILAVGVAATAGFAAAQGPEFSPLDTSFSFQGRLTDGGVPANGPYDFRFILYDAESSGSQVGGTVLRDDVAVSAGIFTVALDFGSASFAGQARWVETAVRPGASTGSYTVLSPRQPVTAAPNALYCKSAPWSGLSGVPAGFADGVDNDTTSFWSLTGNSSTNPNANFLGTTDNQAFEIRANGQRAIRAEPVSSQVFGISTNIIAGAPVNTAATDIAGATVAGGGSSKGCGSSGNDPCPNRATGEFSTVSGGAHNTANGTGTVVSGGAHNTASTEGAAVSGGYFNTASSMAATVGGGSVNTASGAYATVSGGYGNVAEGYISFAAGNLAKASHRGAFVWADSTGSDFLSTGANTFRVRATGGGEFVAGSQVFGLRVDNASTGDGIRAQSNTSNGHDWAALFATNNGTSPAVFASTVGTYSGYFRQNLYVEGDCMGCVLVFLAKNNDDLLLETGDLVTASGIAEALTAGSEPVLLVRRADTSTAGVVGVVKSKAQLITSEKNGQASQSANETDGPVQPTDYLFIVAQGPAQVKIDASSGAIAAGQRLAATGLPGHARALRTVEVKGIKVDESAPIIGVALENFDGGKALAWVMVTLH